MSKKKNENTPAPPSVQALFDWRLVNASLWAENFLDAHSRSGSRDADEDREYFGQIAELLRGIRKEFGMEPGRHDYEEEARVEEERRIKRAVRALMEWRRDGETAEECLRPCIELLEDERGYGLSDPYLSQYQALDLITAIRKEFDNDKPKPDEQKEGD